MTTITAPTENRGMRSAKERRKIIVAGRFVRSIQYALNTDPEIRRTRAPKAEISSVAQEAMNLKHSWQKLKAAIAANFEETDIVVTLTYSDAALPTRRTDAEKKLKAFVRRLRAARKGAPLRYIYVTERGHSSGRLHHHIIINRVDGEDYRLIRELWARNGDNIDVSFIWRKGYDGWARYLSKEPRDQGRHYVGERMWRSSIGLAKPMIFTGWVPAGSPLEAPPNAKEIDLQRRQNGYGSYTYLEYIMPKKSKETLARNFDLG